MVVLRRTEVDLVRVGPDHDAVEIGPLPITGSPYRSVLRRLKLDHATVAIGQHPVRVHTPEAVRARVAGLVGKHAFGLVLVVGPVAGALVVLLALGVLAGSTLPLTEDRLLASRAITPRTTARRLLRARRSRRGPTTGKLRGRSTCTGYSRVGRRGPVGLVGLVAHVVPGRHARLLRVARTDATLSDILGLTRIGGVVLLTQLAGGDGVLRGSLNRLAGPGVVAADGGDLLVSLPHLLDADAQHLDGETFIQINTLLVRAARAPGGLGVSDGRARALVLAGRQVESPLRLAVLKHLVRRPGQSALGSDGAGKSFGGVDVAPAHLSAGDFDLLLGHREARRPFRRRQGEPGELRSDFAHSADFPGAVHVHRCVAGPPTRLLHLSAGDVDLGVGHRLRTRLDRDESAALAGPDLDCGLRHAAPVALGGLHHAASRRNLLPLHDPPVHDPLAGVGLLLVDASLLLTPGQLKRLRGLDSVRDAAFAASKGGREPRSELADDVLGHPGVGQHPRRHLRVRCEEVGELRAGVRVAANRPVEHVAHVVVEHSAASLRGHAVHKLNGRAPALEVAGVGREHAHRGGLLGREHVRTARHLVAVTETDPSVSRSPHTTHEQGAGSDVGRVGVGIGCGLRTAESRVANDARRERVWRQAVHQLPRQRALESPFRSRDKALVGLRQTAVQRHPANRARSRHGGQDTRHVHGRLADGRVELLREGGVGRHRFLGAGPVAALHPPEEIGDRVVRRRFAAAIRPVEELGRIPQGVRDVAPAALETGPDRLGRAHDHTIQHPGDTPSVYGLPGPEHLGVRKLLGATATKDLVVTQLDLHRLRSRASGNPTSARPRHLSARGVVHLAPDTLSRGRDGRGGGGLGVGLRRRDPRRGVLDYVKRDERA